MTKKSFSAALQLLSIAFLIITGLSPSASRANEVTAPQANYRVLSVLDGDTIVVERIGKVRYIGVNTPELHHPSKGKKFYSQEAFAANQQLVAGKKVRLEYDIQPQDKYGRTLAYVYAGKLFVNAKLVADGFARAMPIQPNVRHARYFYRLQQKARAAQKGIWGKPAKYSRNPSLP
jgi:micrococcal nuclease